MLTASKKGETVTEEPNYRQRLRNKKATYTNQQLHQERPYGVNWNAMAERTDYFPRDRSRGFRIGQKRVAPGAFVKEKNQIKPKIGGGMVPTSGGISGDKANGSSVSKTLNNYRVQINQFIESLEEYKNFESTLKNKHDALISMRTDLLSCIEIEPDEVPDVQSSIQNILGNSSKRLCSEDASQPTVSDKNSKLQESYNALEKENKKLEDALNRMRVDLKIKDEDLNRTKEHLYTKIHAGGEGDMHELESLRLTIVKLDEENHKMAEKLKQLESDKSESREDLIQKVRSLEKLIESLHVDIKKLKDQLKIEKEIRNRLENENEKLSLEINDLKNVGSSSDSKYIILEKDAKIQDLQKRLTEISRIRPHHHSANQGEVFKVDFSADTASLVNQLANFVQLYEELSRESFDLESKLKEAHVEIYRLEQILEKQLIKIKEQDECLKNMEESLSKVVVESRKNSRVDHEKSGKCQCEEYQMIIKEKEEFSEKLKEKMSLLYQKYKQYKAESNLMRKKIDNIEKRSWLKKLVNI